MSTTINAQPDILSFSGNLKKIELTATADVTFILQCGAEVILNEHYLPDTAGSVIIDIKPVIERLLSITIPAYTLRTWEQTGAAGIFTITIDALTPYSFTVIKGGVAELTGLATDWLNSHFMTWQPQQKMILQEAPEWISLYSVNAGTLKVKAYFGDSTYYTGTYATLAARKVWSINTSWGAIAEWYLQEQQASGSGSGSGSGSASPVSWDIWYEVSNVRVTPIQRYRLRNSGAEEHVFVWGNTLGGIDSYAFTGAQEEDQKLIHYNALYEDDTIGEYDIDNPREIRQSTGYLEMAEDFWLKDFFYSRQKYIVRADGSLRQIAVIASKVIGQSIDDEKEYEFTFRMGVDGQLLNTERTHTELPAPEGLGDFFLTDLLSGLPEASYSDDLILAVQSPYAIGWQKISLFQLFSAALSSFVDGYTIIVKNGRLTATAVSSVDAETLNILQQYINNLLINTNDSRTELLDGSITYQQGLTYRSTDILYKIIGARYKAIGKEITLDAADPNLSRWDTFYVDTFGNLNIAKGIPAINPVKPVILSNQLELTSVLIGPGALTPTNVDVNLVYDENVEWATTKTEDNYVTVDFNSALAPQSATKRIKVAVNVPAGVSIQPAHNIGDAYQGGIIFYLEAGGKKGLISAVNDTATNMFWASGSGGFTSTGGRGIEIGTGQANTAAMLANAKAKDNAVKYCDELIVATYDDWFMPSEKELYAMYNKRFLIGNFGTVSYWSSTEVNYDNGRCILMSTGTAYSRVKNNVYRVRAIRAFDETTTIPTVTLIPSLSITDTRLIFTSLIPVSVKDGILSMWVKSSLTWLADSALKIETYLGAVQTGMTVMSATTNLYGYTPGDDTWMFVAIDMYRFAPKQNSFDSFHISLTGRWPNGIDLAFDNIRYQHGTMITKSAAIGSVQKTDYFFVEPANGIRTEFTTSSVFIDNSTSVFVNGVRQFAQTGTDYAELNGKIVFVDPPWADDNLVCDYLTLDN